MWGVVVAPLPYVQPVLWNEDVHRNRGPVGVVGDDGDVLHRQPGILVRQDEAHPRRVADGEDVGHGIDAAGEGNVHALGRRSGDELRGNFPQLGLGLHRVDEHLLPCCEAVSDGAGDRVCLRLRCCGRVREPEPGDEDHEFQLGERECVSMRRQHSGDVPLRP